MPSRAILALALVFLLGHGGAYACSNPINPELSSSRLRAAGFDRAYVVTGCADAVPAAGLPLIFAFHGGGERLHDADGTGFLDFTGLSAVHAVVVAPVGNVSHNGHSWINAFPWMKPHPDNDIALPAALLSAIRSRSDLPNIDPGRVFALGKSDGAGMAMALACQRPAGLDLAGVALISGAYFGVGAATNFGRDGHAICLPRTPVPTLLMHGTADRVMPYPGQNFVNPKALKGAADYWRSIDPDVTEGSSRTYTADVAAYVAALSTRVFGCSGFVQTEIGPSSVVADGTGCAARFEVITISGGNHVWPGHGRSGPESGRAPNMDFDATARIAAFFALPR